MQKLLSIQNGIEKVNTLNELSWKLKKSKDSIAINYALAALRLSKKEKFYTGISDAYNRLGVIAKNRKKFSDAKEYYENALKVDQSQNYDYGMARANNQLGVIYDIENQKVKALEYYSQSLAAFEKDQKYRQASKVSRNIATLYLSYQAYKEALEYYLKELDYAILAKDNKLIAKAYMGLGELHRIQKNPKEALSNFRKAAQIFRSQKNERQLTNVLIDIATIYDHLEQDSLSKQTFYKAFDRIRKYKVGNVAAFHHNLATLYKKLDQHDSAKYHYENAIKIYKKDTDTLRLFKTYNNLGNLHQEIEEYPKALAYLQTSLDLQKQTKDSLFLGNTYSALSKVYRNLNDNQKAYLYKDSAYRIRQIEYVKIKKADRYEVDYINSKMALEKANNERIIAEEKAQKRILLLFTLLIVLILCSILLFYMTRIRLLKQQKMIAAYEKEQQEQQIQELINKQEMKDIYAMISGQEAERKRIAQDLHDNLGSKLSLVKIHYQSVEDNLENIDTETKQEYEKANELLDEACKSVREISHNMLSGTLSKFGLMPALKELKQTIETACNKQQQREIQIELTSHKFDDRLDNTMEIEIYRVIQELLNNIIKHAKATHVAIQILKRDHEVNIIVEDNGIGFDTSTEYQGFGLKTIQSRITSMKGTYHIDSGKGNGTTVTIDIPT
ncbi:MAG: tetratricopeptide repeat protein [Bacteroidota bacterium]